MRKYVLGRRSHIPKPDLTGAASLSAHRATTNQIIELLQQSVVFALGRDLVGYGRVVFDHGLRVEFEFHGHGLRTRHLSGLAQGRVVTHTVEAHSARRVGVGGRLGRRLWRRRSGPVETFGLPPPHGRVRTGHQGGGVCPHLTPHVPCLPPLFRVYHPLFRIYHPLFRVYHPLHSHPPDGRSQPPAQTVASGATAVLRLVPLSTIEGRGTPKSLLLILNRSLCSWQRSDPWM